MSPLALGALYGVSTLVVMFSGIPIAFALGIVAVVFMYFFMPASALDTVAQNVYEEMGNIVILSIPLFILKGAAIGRTDAGRDGCVARIRGAGAGAPAPRCSGEPDVVRAPQVQHAIEDMDGHVHLGGPTLIGVRAQPV